MSSIRAFYAVWYNEQEHVQYSIPFQDKFHPTHARRRRAATSRYLLWVVFFVYRWGILLILKKIVK